MVNPSPEVVKPRKSLRHSSLRPTLDDLSLTNLPSYLSPLPLPTKLSSLLHSLCYSHDPVLHALVHSLQSRTVDLDSFERSLWCRVSAVLQPSYDAVFDSVDYAALDARVASEKRERGLERTLSATFGEVPLESLACILARHVQLREGEAFVDVGSGLGRGVVAAGLCHAFGSLLGVELLSSLHEDAHALLQSASIAPPVRLLCADALTCDAWLCCDVAFINSTCFEPALMRRLSERCAHLRLGSRVITLTHPLSSSHFSARMVGSYRMSWGDADVWVHVKQEASSPLVKSR